MPRSLATVVRDKDTGTREAKMAIRDELATRLTMCSDTQAASIAKVLNQILDEIEAMPDPDAVEKTAQEREADEVAAARAEREARKAAGTVVGRKRAAK